MGLMGFVDRLFWPSFNDEIVAASAVISDDDPEYEAASYRAEMDEVISPEDVLHEEQVYEQVEFGLGLPNGKSVWGDYHGYSFKTEADRQLMLAVLKKSAEDTGFEEDEFLECYTWTARKVVTTISRETVMSIDSPLAIGVPIEPEVEPEVKPEEGELI